MDYRTTRSGRHSFSLSLFERMLNSFSGLDEEFYLRLFESEDPVESVPAIFGIRGEVWFEGRHSPRFYVS